MNTPAPLAEFFKALADADRVRLIGLLAEREYSLPELSTVMQIDAPTVTQHLNAMREVGLVNLRNTRDVHSYWLNDGVLKRFKQAVNTIEQAPPPPAPPADTSWVDALGVDAEAREILLAHTDGQHLKRVPTKAKKFSVIIAWLATRFEMGRTYTEQEINAVLREHNEDYAILRRGLVDEGFFEREANGRTYWRVR